MKRLLHISLVPVALLVSLCAASQSLEPNLKLNSRNGLRQNTVWSLTEDSLGRMWMGTPGSFEVYNGHEVLETGVYSSVYQSFATRDYVYALSREGVVRFDVHTRDTIMYEMDGGQYKWRGYGSEGIELKHVSDSSVLYLDGDLRPSPPIPDLSYTTLTEGQVNCGPQPIAYSMNGAWLVGQADSSLVQTPVRSVVEWTPERVLFSCAQGMLECNWDGQQVNSKLWFTDERVELLHRDRADNLWVATSGDGVYRIHRNAMASSWYPATTASGKRIACWSFFETESGLFNCTSEGLMALGPDPKGLVELTRGKFTISGASRGNTVLVGTADAGIYRVDPGGLTQVYVDLEDALNNTIITLAATESGFRATTKRGVVHFDAEGNPTQYTGFPALGIGTYIMHMIPEGDGYLASSVMGLYRLDRNLQCTDTLHAATMDVISMTRIERDQLWAVSMNEGLLRWQDDHLVSEDFPSKQLFTLLITPEGKWITGAQGLYRHTDQGVWTLNAASGIPIDEYDQNGAWQASNGRLYFGGVGGVVGMDPANMSPSKVWPSLAWPEDLTLDYDQGEAVVHLETITAVAPDNHRIYVVHESDTTWIKPGVRELVVHAPYGESALTWHAERLSDGHHMTRTLPILRAYPFWTAWWFWVIIAVLVAALVAGGYSLFKFIQTRRLLRTEQAQKKVTEERLRISRELHDNIGARLTHIISSLDVEMYQREETAEPLANINAFARQTMAQLRETIWAVSDKTVFFSEFATRVDQYAAETRRLTGIDVRVSNWVQGDFQLNPVQTINFFRILQEAINNAVKYAKPQGIDVGMQWTPGEYARFVVEDDGVGFAPKHHAHGTGVNGMRQRAQEADADFSLTSAPGQGTRIEVTFAPE